MAMRSLIRCGIVAALMGGVLLPAAAEEPLPGHELIEDFTMQPETR